MTCAAASVTTTTRESAARPYPRPLGRDGAVGRLEDARGRRVDYLRLAVTDRCNLRCRYCMPAAGLPRGESADILSWEELLRIARITCALGIRKIRITGGEPLVRAGVGAFCAAASRLPGRPELLLTTNGTRLAPALADLATAGVRRLNVSLDSLDERRYRDIARRGRLGDVLAALDAADAAGFGLKINVVVLPGLNDGELPAFVALTRDRPWTVRFIEPMPFGGGADAGANSLRAGAPRGHCELFSADLIVERLAAAYDLEPLPEQPTAVDRLYRVRGYAGRIGVIAGHSRTFCASCSRMRVSAAGLLHTCLYARPTLDLKALLRAGADDATIAADIAAAVYGRPADGIAAERERVGYPSMAQIGG